MNDETTTDTRDGWHDHAIAACDKMHEAHVDLVRAQHHLEREFKQRLQPLIDRQKKLCGESLEKVGKVKVMRDAALLTAAVSDG